MLTHVKRVGLLGLKSKVNKKILVKEKLMMPTYKKKMGNTIQLMVMINSCVRQIIPLTLVTK